MIFDTLEPSCAKLKKSLKLLNCDQDLNFVCIKKCFRDFFLKFFEEENFEKHDWDDELIYLVIDKNELKSIEIVVPDGLEMKSLSLSDIDKIYSLWPHAHKVPRKLVEKFIKYNPTIALFDEKSQLIAWMFYNDQACGNGLHVDPKYLGRGYGKLVGRALARKVAEELDYDFVIGVLPSNEKSLNLFSKNGKRFDDMTFVGSKGRKNLKREN